jgi:hypothetical protein
VQKKAKKRACACIDFRRFALLKGRMTISCVQAVNRENQKGEIFRRMFSGFGKQRSNKLKFVSFISHLWK